MPPQEHLNIDMTPPPPSPVSDLHEVSSLSATTTSARGVAHKNATPPPPFSNGTSSKTTVFSSPTWTPPSSKSIPKLTEQVGGTVLTSFGLARILQVRSNGIIQCQLKNNNGKRESSSSSSSLSNTILILNQDAYQVVSQTLTVDMSSVELAKYAIRLQAFAAAEWKHQHAGLALQLYQRVLTVASMLLKLQRHHQQQQPDHPDHGTNKYSLPVSQRGDWLIRTVKCNNTAAQIAIHLHQHSVALDCTKEALNILDALESNRKKQEESDTNTTSNKSNDDNKNKHHGNNNKKQQHDEEGSQTENSSVASSSNSSHSSSSSSVLELGLVKLFGECRIKSLLLTAQALLEIAAPDDTHDSNKSLTVAALKLLERAQLLLRKYTAPKYLEQREFRPIMKAFVGLQKELKKLKKQAKARMVVSKPPPMTTVEVVDTNNEATTESLDSPSSSLASWLRSRRVCFSDDQDNNKNNDMHKDTGDTDKTTTAEAAPSDTHAVLAANVITIATTTSSSSSLWMRETLMYGSVVAGGLVLFHFMLRQQRR